jgi:hypothetical protein
MVGKVAEKYVKGKVMAVARRYTSCLEGSQAPPVCPERGSVDVKP